MRAISKGLLEGSEIFFHTASNMANSLLYHIHSAGEFFCDGDYSMARGIRPEIPVHRSCQVILVQDGLGEVTICGVTRTVYAGEVIIMDCHEPHSYSTSKYWHTIWMHYNGAESINLTNTIIDKWGPVVRVDQNSAVPRYLKLVIDYFRKPSLISEPLLSAYIYNVLMDLLAGPTTESYIPPTIAKVLSYIEVRYREFISLEELATLVNMSPTHLTRSFKTILGYSPYEYIIKTRIGNAKNLLKGTDLSVKEVGLQCGFNDESHFVATFHRKTRMTPKKFRYYGI